MLQASSERAAAARLWVPGMIPGPMDAVSARAQEIARRREEMLGMLHDLPESEYELSLTDLVEKAGGEEAAAPPAEGRDPAAARSASGRPERRASARRRTDSGSTGGSSFRSSSDGVLLNFYTPRSLTRSFTAPRPSRTPSFAGGRTPSVASECYKRERDLDAETVKCWSLLWDRRWRKSSRRDPGSPPGESAMHAASAAILKAAKHSAASPAKV
ncbi:uncharacterized protein LOC120690273 [Panicum virgatum]|uniref:Uncharacterized protein n=1 Tax=Panicum virgatum TaxID=38727 RepID=A0A8T0N335_PANVG|nr:uncharacterized protein LOC120690273 [Panicum virgatum]KAG2543860.1 hypothetical protein PVAP13_9NG772400 [Panicum virgatum]